MKKLLRILPLFLIISFTGCTPDDTMDPMDDPMDDPELGQVIIVRGVDGPETNLPGDCETSFNGTLRCISVDVSPLWTPFGEGGSPDEPVLTELLYNITPDEELRMGFEVHYKTELEANPYPNAAFIFGGVPIENVTFGDREFTIYKDGEDSWVAAIPTITFKDWKIPGETGDIYAVLRFGTFIDGDTGLLNEADVLQLFRSVVTPRCMGDWYAPLFQNKTIQYVPK